MLPSAIGTARVEPLPVEERISVVTEDRRAIEPSTNVAQGQREVVWQQRRGLEPDLIDVGRCQKTDPDVVEPDGLQGKIAGGQGRDPKLTRMRAKQVVVQEAGQVSPQAIEHGQFRVTWELDERVVLGEEPAARQFGIDHDGVAPGVVWRWRRSAKRRDLTTYFLSTSSTKVSPRKIQLDGAAEIGPLIPKTAI